MMKHISVAAGVIVLSAGTLLAQTGREIMEKVDRLPQPSTVRSLATMTITKGGHTMIREISLKGIKAGPNEKVILSVTSPFRLTVLTHTVRGGEDLQWLKQRNGTVKRIVTGDRNKPFVNSHIYYEDLRSRHLDDYTYRLLGSARVQQYDCWKVEAVPRPGKSVYDKAYFYIIKAGQLANFAVKAEIFYKGYLYKDVTNFNIKVPNGIITPYKAVMQRYNRSGSALGQTVVEIKRLQYNSSRITDAMFHRSKL
ncbi:MAG TPA: outer membrane lipoprotein-sorting protein [Spirochaetota bacterium]|nr:outer membrane lipoprotein-sorting protein [Spirochaetota bacterium]